MKQVINSTIQGDIARSLSAAALMQRNPYFSYQILEAKKRDSLILRMSEMDKTYWDTWELEWLKTLSTDLLEALNLWISATNLSLGCLKFHYENGSLISDVYLACNLVGNVYTLRENMEKMYKESL